MGATYQRACLLFDELKRYDLAERELRGVLVEDPDNPLAHALLSLCLIQLQRLDEAQSEVEEAVRLGPERSFIHYARARLLGAHHKLRQARAALEEAIRLDPQQADYFSWLAAFRYDGSMVKEALMAAEKGLEIDPLNVGCINLRALALGRLGRTKEARATSLNSLARDPVNAISHAIQGTTLLRQAEYGLAMASFLEGLRLDPLCEWAHRGRRKARLGFGLVWPAWAIGHSLLRLAGAHRAHFKEPTIRRAGWLGSLVLLAAGALVGGAALGEPLVSAFLLAYCLALVGLSWVFHLIPGAVGHLGQLLCLILSLCILLFPFLLIIYINFNLSVSMIRIFAYLEAAIVTASFVALNQFLIGLAWADELAEASLPRRRKK